MNKNLSALIMVVIAVGIYVTVTQSLINGAEQVQTVNNQYLTALADAARLVAVRDQVRATYDAISENDRARLDKMIPSTVDNIRLIIDLSSVAASHGLALKGISAAVSSNSSSPSSAPTAAPATSQMNATGTMMPSSVSVPGALPGTIQTVSAPVLDTVTVSFGVSATYDQFISLLQDMEADLRIMDLTHLTVTANNAGLYDFSVQFQTYWIRQTS